MPTETAPAPTKLEPRADDDLSWLRKHSPHEWIQIALGELRRATTAFELNDMGAGVASCKRAAGMALNGALSVAPDPRWGRTYVEHVRALSTDETVPVAVRDACTQLLDARPPNPHLLTLRVPRGNERIVEAARDVMAHALAVVIRHEAG